jgi:FAD/FMN-containing dehydrogenase
VGGIMTERLQSVSSWGRLSREGHRVVGLHDRDRMAHLLHSSMFPGLAYGNGRSYGDVCLNPGGTLWTTRGLDRFIAFDADAGVLQCEAGVMLKEIIELTLPRGWFPPVVPGTQFVTVGGSIANDVHGKAHHVAGSFGDHVLDLELLRTDGTLIHCSRSENREWFEATVGGLGLTGLITRARLKLRKVEGPWLDAETTPFDSLERFFELSDQSKGRYDYTVSWIDCVRGERGRGIFFRGSHARRADLVAPRRARTLLFTPPVSLVNRLSLQLFNHLYYAMQRVRQGRGEQHYIPFFFPLDNLLQWNRMYGPQGFYQYQSVVPNALALDATRQMLREIAASGLGSFLAVLKTFGDRPAPGMLSFPMSGTTLALDFPNGGERTMALFSRLNAIVRDAGGRIYPAKDACMPRELFERGYPRLSEFLRYRDPGISSAMSRRLMGN